jgi:hypothetical protein
LSPEAARSFCFAGDAGTAGRGVTGVWVCRGEFGWDVGAAVAGRALSGAGPFAAGLGGLVVEPGAVAAAEPPAGVADGAAG